VAVVALVAAPSLGAADAPPLSPEARAALESARRAADELTADLMKTLVEEMAAGGPSKAVRVCAEVAPGVARQHSTGGRTVRRVTLKSRNPASAPDAFEREQLQRLEREGVGPASGAEVIVESRSGSTAELRYMRPIFVSGPCLACHGALERLDLAVTYVLAEKYPGDRAVGYKPGDLRGAVSVRVPVAAPAAPKP
jgi:hypothetical protein